MLLTPTRRRCGPSALFPSCRLHRRMLSGGCLSSSAASASHATKTAALSGFLRDTCLPAAHIPPQVGTPEDGVTDMLGTSGALSKRMGDAQMSCHLLPPSADEARPRSTPPCKRKGEVTEAPMAIDCDFNNQSLPALSPLPSSGKEGGPFSRDGIPGSPLLSPSGAPKAGGGDISGSLRSALFASAAHEGLAGPTSSAVLGQTANQPNDREAHSSSPRPSKRAPRPRPSTLLQLPLGNIKGRRKLQVLSPSVCCVLDVSNSPLSVISQASTTCALLSSASSLDSCSQPATPNCSWLDSALSSGLQSPLPQTNCFNPPLRATSQITAEAAAAPKAAKAKPAYLTLQQGGGVLKGGCCYEVHAYGEQATQTQPKLSNPNPEEVDTKPEITIEGTVAETAAAIAASAQPATEGAETQRMKTVELSTPPSEESTVATSFLASPTNIAAPSPLRLPIPARSLRRLQNPRILQQLPQPQQKRVEERDSQYSNISSHPLSLRRLQLPKLRHRKPESSCRGSPSWGTPLPASAFSVLGRSETGACCIVSQQQQQRTAYEGPLPNLCPPMPKGCVSGACVSCRASGPQDELMEPPKSGGALGDAFEEAAHAAHVAAHAAARAAAHAAAHAAVLKRKAAEAYWCSQSLPRPSFRIYPDLERDIHRDYNLYCAAPPSDVAANRDSHMLETEGMSSQSTASSMAVDSTQPSLKNKAHAKNSVSAGPPGGYLVLGEGRYGKVVLAEHRRTQQMVAVKMLDKRRVLADDAWDCRQELEMHRRLPHHPHVVSVLDVYEDRKSLYILMELCDRNTLVDRIVSDGAFTEEQAKLIFAQLLFGVMHCHNNNIVHRDLKPENILFAREVDNSPLCSSPSSEHWSVSNNHLSSPDIPHSYPSFPASFEQPPAQAKMGGAPTSIVKITDFGSACYATPGELSGTTCGTIHYLAPEVLAGNYYDGFLSDVWSLGVILYIILSATPPFYGKSDGEVVQKIVAGSYSMNGYQWRIVSDECKDIIRRLLTVDHRCRMTLNEAISHPWFIPATGMGSSLPMLGCPRCSVVNGPHDGALVNGPYDGVADEGPHEDFEVVCFCSKCHPNPCEGAALISSPSPCHACCSSPTAEAPWVPAPTSPCMELSMSSPERAWQF